MLASALWLLSLAPSSWAQSRPHVTFIGFQQTAEGPRLFVHLTGQPERVLTRRVGKQVSLNLVEMDIGAKNNRYPLDLSAFNGPLLEARLVPAAADVVLELSLRNEAVVMHDVERRPDGTVVLTVRVR